jgi:hypothetical protein
MQSLKRGFIFVKQVFGMTRLNPAGLRPSGYSVLTGLAIALVCLILIGLSLATGWGSPAGMALTGFLLCAMLFGQLAAGAIFSALTATQAYAHLIHEPPGPTGQLASLRKTWLDLLLFSLASPGLWAASRFKLLSSHLPASTPPRPDGQAELEEVVAETPLRQSAKPVAFDTTWVNASYLVIPIMGIEGLKLKESLSRAAQFIQSHALRLSANLIGVRPLSWLVGGLLSLIGIASGWSLYHFTIQHSHGIALRSALFASLSLFTFDLFFLAAIVFGAYINTVYATCLYLWSCTAEKARLENLTEPASVPMLLAAALEK